MWPNNCTVFFCVSACNELRPGANIFLILKISHIHASAGKLLVKQSNNPGSVETPIIGVYIEIKVFHISFQVKR